MSAAVVALAFAILVQTMLIAALVQHLITRR